tara:strand:- start:314 stop:748 length:435 start_codon:yes stop_codon:yes gene_type:complete
MSALTSCRTFARLLARAIVDTPQIRGVNNLMGSEITQQNRHMSWFIENIGCRGLYFVDSRTPRLTVAAFAETRAELPIASGDVFLDHDRSSEEMPPAWDGAHRLAQHTGFVVLITQPYPKTLDFLELKLSERPDNAVQIVSRQR